MEEDFSNVEQFPITLYANLKGFRYLVNLWYRGRKFKNEEFILDIRNTKFIDKNILVCLCLIIGRWKFLLVKCKVKYEDELYDIDNEGRIFETLMRRKISIDDKFSSGTVISYSADEKDRFRSDLKQLVNEIGMEERYVSILQSRISELFINVKRHGRHNVDYGKREVYFGYAQESRQAVIGMVNNGEFIQNRIRDIEGIEYNFQWQYLRKALQRGFSTKPENENSGLGLHLIKDLVEQSRSELIIISGGGYYSLAYNRNDLEVCEAELPGIFPGTCILLKINIDNLHIIEELEYGGEDSYSEKIFGEEYDNVYDLLFN